MSKKNYRQERIERLLDELRYEITRGMMEGEIEEQLTFSFIVPVSKVYPTNGVVMCRFETRPLEHQAFLPSGSSQDPGLRVVGGKDTETE